MVGTGKIRAEDANFVIGAAQDDDRQSGAGWNGTHGHDELRRFRKFQVVIHEQKSRERIDAAVSEGRFAFEIGDGRLGRKERLDVKGYLGSRNGALEEKVIVGRVVDVNNFAIAIEELWHEGTVSRKTLVYSNRSSEGLERW